MRQIVAKLSSQCEPLPQSTQRSSAIFKNFLCHKTSHKLRAPSRAQSRRDARAANRISAKCCRNQRNALAPRVPLRRIHTTTHNLHTLMSTQVSVQFNFPRLKSHNKPYLSVFTSIILISITFYFGFLLEFFVRPMRNRR